MQLQQLKLKIELKLKFELELELKLELKKQLQRRALTCAQAVAQLPESLRFASVFKRPSFEVRTADSGRSSIIVPQVLILRPKQFAGVRRRTAGHQCDRVGSRKLFLAFTYWDMFALLLYWQFRNHTMQSYSWLLTVCLDMCQTVLRAFAGRCARRLVSCEFRRCWSKQRWVQHWGHRFEREDRHAAGSARCGASAWRGRRTFEARRTQRRCAKHNGETCPPALLLSRCCHKLGDTAQDQFPFNMARSLAGTQALFRTCCPATTLREQCLFWFVRRRGCSSE